MPTSGGTSAGYATHEGFVGQPSSLAGPAGKLIPFDIGFGRSVVFREATRREGKQVVQAGLRQFAPGSQLVTGICGDFAHLGNSAIRDCAETDHIHVGAANLCFHRVGRQITAQPAVHLEERVIVGVRHDFNAVDVSHGQSDIELLRRVIFGFDGNSPSQINRVHVRCSQSRTSARTFRRAFRVTERAGVNGDVASLPAFAMHT